MEHQLNDFKQHLQEHGISIICLAKASYIHPTRLSQLVNLWIRPKNNDLKRLRSGFRQLGLDVTVANSIEALYENSLK